MICIETLTNKKVLNQYISETDKPSFTIQNEYGIAYIYGELNLEALITRLLKSNYIQK